MATVALVVGGPSALVAAIALARRGIATSVFERELHPEQAPRFNPDRLYTIDISGHGLRALRYVDACRSFDVRMFHSLFENRYHILRASLASRFGVSMFDQAKSATVPYLESRRKAESLWPLWA